jgi:hypothetical protein
MRIAVISDTHMTGRGRRQLPAPCLELIRSADLLIHAGDVMTEEALAEIEAIGPPLAAVSGNMDPPALRLPHERDVETPAGVIAVTHDAGPPAGRLRRMRQRFPAATALVFGHSHIPLHESEDGFQIFNPGSPTDRRRAPRHTMGIAAAGDAGIAFELIDLDA